MALAILNPIGQYFDLDGSPLDAGYMYFGVANQNPITSPATVYWDAAETIPASQPIRTVNGYPVRFGAPAMVFSSVDVSMLVRNRRGEQVFYAADSADFGNAVTALAAVADLEGRLADTTDPDNGAGMIGYLRDATGQEVDLDTLLSWSPVNVFEFMTPAQIADVVSNTGALNVTSAITAAKAVSRWLIFPAGTYGVDDYRVSSGERWFCAGIGRTIFRQLAAGTPAIRAESDSTYSHLAGISLTGFTVLGYKTGATAAGHSSATHPAFVVKGSSGYAVWMSEFKYRALEVYQGLHIDGIAANNVFRCQFQVDLEGAEDWAFYLNGGVYNKFNLSGANCWGGKTVYNVNSSSLFEQCTGDGQQVHIGSGNELSVTVEAWPGTSASGNAAIQNLGTGNQFRNVSILLVPRSKAETGILLNGVGVVSDIQNLTIQGTTASITFTGALVGATSGTLTAAWELDETGNYYTTFSDGTRKKCSFTNGSTSVTWSGAVTATASATMVHSVPRYPLSIPAGNTGTFTNARTPDCEFKLEEYVSPTSILEGFGFLGDCSTLSNYGKLARKGNASDRGDNSVTLVAGTDYEIQLFGSNLTADRTITLSSTNAVKGDFFRIVRTGLGAFTLDVGGLKTMPSATAAWCHVDYTGSTWVLTGYGLL